MNATQANIKGELFAGNKYPIDQTKIKVLTDPFLIKMIRNTVHASHRDSNISFYYDMGDNVYTYSCGMFCMLDDLKTRTNVYGFGYFVYYKHERTIVNRPKERI